MRRRTLLIGIWTNAISALSARAQQTSTTRRIGVLLGFSDTDKEAQGRVAALKKSLASLGWREGSNVQFEVRWTGGDANRASAMAKELLELEPDVVFGNSSPIVSALVQQTQKIPIIFISVTDPIALKFATSFSHPGGNVTGFTNLEPSLGGKWVDLLNQLVPQMKRIGMLWNPDTVPHYRVYLSPFQIAAKRLGLEAIEAPVRSVAEIEEAIRSIGSDLTGGLVIMPDIFLAVHRKEIISLVDQHKVPVIYPLSYMARDGGLISYGIDLTAQYRQAAEYVDKILKGQKVNELPIQQPTAFELVLNLKAARSLGIEIPNTLSSTADSFVE